MNVCFENKKCTEKSILHNLFIQESYFQSNMYSNCTLVYEKFQDVIKIVSLFSSLNEAIYFMFCYNQMLITVVDCVLVQISFIWEN